MSDRLTKEQVSDYLTVFGLYDFFDNGQVDTRYLGSILLFLKKRFTLESLRKMKRDVDPEGKGFFTRREFMALMTHLMQEEHMKMNQQKQEDGPSTSQLHAVDEEKDGAATSTSHAKEVSAAENSEQRATEETLPDTWELLSIEEDVAGILELCSEEQDASIEK